MLIILSNIMDMKLFYSNWMRNKLTKLLLFRKWYKLFFQSEFWNNCHFHISFPIAPCFYAHQCYTVIFSYFHALQNIFCFVLFFSLIIKFILQKSSKIPQYIVTSRWPDDNVTLWLCDRQINIPWRGCEYTVTWMWIRYGRFQAFQWRH